MVSPESIRKRLIRYASEKYGEITPCRNLETLEESFISQNGRTVFWFNTKDRSTRCIVYKGNLETAA